MTEVTDTTVVDEPTEASALAFVNDPANLKRIAGSLLPGFFTLPLEALKAKVDGDCAAVKFDSVELRAMAEDSGDEYVPWTVFLAWVDGGWVPRAMGGDAASTSIADESFAHLCIDLSTVSTIMVEPPPVGTVASSSGWSRVAVLGGEGSSLTMYDVAAGGPGLVAVGEELDTSTLDFDGVVWTSPDGVTWTRVPDDGVFGGDVPQVVAAVTQGGPGLVAVGMNGFDGGVWTSSDGMSWTFLSDHEGVFAGATISDVSRYESGLVAVGHTGALNEDNDAAVWLSGDGVTWTRVPHDEDVFGGEGTQAMFGVIRGGPGLVAVGRGVTEKDAAAAVWTSPDGMTWSRVRDSSDLSGEGDQWMRSVTSGGPGLVAVGLAVSDNGRSPAVWTSPDGVTWTRVHDDDALVGGGIAEMHAVTANGAELVAVGSDLDDDQHAAIWTSPDGLTWSRVPNEAALAGGVIYSLSSEGSNLIAVGSVAPDAAVWIPANTQP